MANLNKLMEMPTNQVDESISEETQNLLDRIREAQISELRRSFRMSLIDTYAMACVKVANDLGFTDLAKEFIETIEEMEVPNA
jgi:hypothetical protein